MFAQWWNCLMTHFLECILVVKWHVTVLNCTGMEPDILLLLPFLAGRASDFQGREQTVSHTQQECKYLLPNLYCSQDPYFHVETPFSCLGYCSGYLTGLHPILHIAANQLLRKFNQCSLAQNPSVLPVAWFFVKGQAPFWEFQEHPREEKNVCTAWSQPSLSG